MLYAIMNFLGPSDKNQEWNQTKQFDAFLRSKGEKRNHLRDIKSSRFGLYPETAVLVSYHFK